MVTMFPSALQLLPEFFRTAPLTKLIPSQMGTDKREASRSAAALRRLRKTEGFTNTPNGPSREFHWRMHFS
jgi:hypothetical protein